MSGFNPGVTQHAAYDPEGLLVSDHDTFTDDIVVVSGQNLVAGTLLGKITSGGKFNKSLSGASDGSQTPVAILKDDCDASSGDKPARAYFAGGFNTHKMVFGTAHTAASTRQALAARGIFTYDSYAITE